ncbi:MAG TPA: NAD(P)H-binding protein, partial [Chthoniobacterales bacterium]
MSSPSQLNQQPVLVTGVTGYIGGRLVPRLLAKGTRLRCLARDASRLQGTAWRGDIELVVGDVLRPESLAEAMHEVVSAYYLVHSLGAGSDFPERDVMAARHFGATAKNAGVKRIIYLGGLGDPGTALSAHLRSRQETGDALRESGVPVTEFRAGVIVGSGSLSFEMIRCLTERLPVMVCPRWVYTRIQPIAVGTVLDYLVEALHVPASAGRTIEIGGADVVTYAEMLTVYAEVRGLRRWLIPVPVLTPKLSSYWVHFVTPIPAAIAKPLIAGLRNEILVRDNVARCLFPAIQPPDYRTAVRIALEQLRADKVETAWTGALWTSHADPPVMLTSEAGMIIEQRQITIDASAETIFRAFA